MEHSKCESIGQLRRPSYTVNYKHAPRAEYAAITSTMSTDTIETFL